MGCFNLICGYSGLEIHSDDTVQLHFLVNNHFGDGFQGHMCYPHDCFSLLAPPIKAQYDEYGWYHFDDTDLLTIMIQQEITKLIDLSVIPRRSYKGSAEYFKANQSLDIKDRSLIPWEVVGELIHDGNLFIKNRYGKSTQVYISKFAVHDELYQNIATKDIKVGWGDNEKTLREHVTENVMALSTDTTNIKAIRAIPENKRTHSQVLELLTYETKMYDAQDNRMEFVSNSFSIPNLVRYVSPTGEKITSGQIIELIVGMKALHSEMDNIRKMYLPQHGGHQCYNFDAEIEHLEAMLLYVKKRQAEYGEDYED